MHTDNKLLDGLRCEQIVIKWQKQIVKTLASLSFVSTVIRIIVHSASIMSVCGMYTDLKADCFHTFMIYRETAAIESKFDCLHSLAAPDCISWYLNVLFFCIAQGSNCSIDTSSHRNFKFLHSVATSVEQLLAFCRFSETSTTLFTHYGCELMLGYY